jgi:hypothetical protein
VAEQNYGEDFMPVKPQVAVDLWHADDTPNGILQREEVRGDWPELGKALDFAEPSFMLDEPDEQPAVQPTVRVTNEGAVWIGLFMFFVGMGVGMALQFGVLNRWDAQ